MVTEMAALVILMVVIVLVAGGVFANVYLYARGAFVPKEFSESVAVREAAEQRYYDHVGAHDDSTERYARRVIGAFLIGAVLVITILILFWWQSMLH
jgi:hypothetical protein